MRIAFLSDIHSNYEALTAVLEDIEVRSVHEILCLGDVVGYGAEPLACIALVRQHCGLVLQGNHDQAAYDPGMWKDFSPGAALSAKWTHAKLPETDRDYLRGLPWSFARGDMLLVHASPGQPKLFAYVYGEMDARSYATIFEQRLCLIGHTHIPRIFPLSSGVTTYDADHRFMINVGSVGQPRDGDSRACYGLLDSVAGTFDHIRVPYDVELAGKKILAAGLPKELALRLKIGR